MKFKYSLILFCLSINLILIHLIFSQSQIKWNHFSSAKGDIPILFNGKDLTSMAILDANNDGIWEFAITERSSGPSVVLYLKAGESWKPYIVESEPTPIAAGSDAADIDGDGDTDIVAGGASLNEVWWWENPYPNLDPAKSWKKRVIKKSGGRKQHDQLFGDFDGDGKDELAFWNQGSQCLFVAEIPENPRLQDLWELIKVYEYSIDSEMPQRGSYPDFRGVHEHEGLTRIDIDGDGKLDIVGGGRWFKHLQGKEYQENIIDASYVFSRAAAGDIIKGGRPEVVLAVGDGWAPMIMYEWQEIKNKGGAWIPKEVIGEVDCAHSLKILDFNKDGFMDIWYAEMRLNDLNPDSKHQVLLGDGKGNFNVMNISTGIGIHESEMVDLDGDGDYDVVSKPYRWESPRIDIWINLSQ
jgi:hypothetical protein